MAYSGKVEICGVNTAKLKVLKNDEMVELLQRIQNGDKQAREEMISGNLLHINRILGVETSILNGTQRNGYAATMGLTFTDGACISIGSRSSHFCIFLSFYF